MDLHDRRVVETVNLGGASIMAIGEAAIGRLVRADGTALFESAPLCVPPDVASAVADSPTDWIDALAAGCRGDCGEVLSDLIARMHHFDLLCDLPATVRRHIVQPLDPGLRPDRVGMGGNGREYDTALVLAALGGDLPVEEEPFDGRPQADERRPLTALVAAALLEPGTIDALSSMLVASDAQVLRGWADTMSAPADIVCRRLAHDLAAAA